MSQSHAGTVSDLLHAVHGSRLGHVLLDSYYSY